MLIPRYLFILLVLGMVFALLGVMFSTELTGCGVFITCATSTLIILTAKPERHTNV